MTTRDELVHELARRILFASDHPSRDPRIRAFAAAKSREILRCAAAWDRKQSREEFSDEGRSSNVIAFPGPRRSAEAE
jgi:hypothetical protein